MVDICKKYSIEDTEELIKMVETIETKEKEIQANFDFIIPNYVLREIVITQGRFKRYNVITLINLAKINNRISKKNAEILKKFVLELE